MQRVKTPGGAPPAILPPSAKIAWRGVFGVLAALGLASAADDTSSMFKPARAVPGGLDPHATITSIAKTQDTAAITWSGFLKPFTVERTPSLTPPLWETILSTTDTQGTVPAQGDMGLFRVQSPAPLYVGAYICGGCHDGTHDQWANTIHARAFETLKAIRQDKNASCLPCHTVGYGLPTGFKDEVADPMLAGVQCENCHGPGGRHVADPDDLSARPIVTIAAETCGGCHTDFHHPTFDEWLDAGHSHVSEEGMFNSGVGRMYQCGVCHSGAVRRGVVRDYDEGGDGSSVAPPTITDANTYGQVCTTCHDPHQSFTNVLLTASGEPLLDELGKPIEAKPHQLRNPIGSVKFMSFLTSTNPMNFAAQYDPDIQMCGQCHNERGAAWNGTGRPPHHSPQYNILIGQVVDPSLDTNHWNGLPAGHGDPTAARPDGNPYQCTACHNRAEEEESPTPANPNYTGHRFEVQLLACAECHGFLDEPNAEEFAEEVKRLFIQEPTVERMEAVIAALNNWATNKITDLYVPGSTNYVTFIGTNNPALVVPWEFSTIGQLNAGKKSPPTAGQNRMLKFAPEILQARFLLYMVEHDASYGVHNPSYVRSILDKAQGLAENAPVIPAE